MVIDASIVMRKGFCFAGIAGLLSLAGGAALLFCTRWGAGLSPDSAVYIGAARNLLAGEGWSVPSYDGAFVAMTQYPPLFPTVLAGLGLLGVDPVDGSRWLNAILFAGNIALAGLWVWAATRSLEFSLSSTLLVMTSFPMVQIHSMAWSEPLFIFLALLGLLFLALYIQEPNGLTLVAACATASLALLTRYAGVALTATGVMAMLLLGKRLGSQRILDIALFGALSCLPVVLWLGRNLAVAGSAASREIAFHPLTGEDLRFALGIISSWLLPATIPLAARWIGIVVVATAGVCFFFSARRQDLAPR